MWNAQKPKVKIVLTPKMSSWTALIFLLLIVIFSTVHVYAKQNESDSLKKFLLTAKEDTNKVHALYQLSELSENPDEIMEYAKRSFSLAEKLGYEKGMAEALNNIGYAYAYAMKPDIDSSMHFYRRSFELFSKMGNRIGMALVHNNIGALFRNKGENNAALVYFFKSLRWRIEANDKEGMAFSYNNIAGIYLRQSDYVKAIEYYQHAQRLYEQINDKSGLARTLNSLSSLHHSQGDFEIALIEGKKGLQLYEESGDRMGSSNALNTIGEIYSKLGKISLAMEYFGKCRKIREELGNRNSLPIVYNNIGNLYMLQNDFASAMDYYQKGRIISEDSKNYWGISTSLTNIGNVYFKQKKFNDAEKTSIQALEMAKKIGYPDNIRRAARILSEIYKSKGNYKNALEMYVLFSKMNDSVSNAETGKILVKKQMQYEYDKRESLIKAENDKQKALNLAEIKQQKTIRNMVLGGTCIAGMFSFLLVRGRNQKKKTEFEKNVSDVEMKALRAQMNPHFIKNSLNSIDDYIQEHDINSSSKYLNKFSKLMGEILEYSRQEEVLLSQDIETLKLYMEIENLRMPEKVKCSVSLSEEINPDQVMIQPMLLQPFVENAFKHAFDEVKNPELHIVVSLQQNMLHFTVTDNGRGRHWKQEVSVNNKPGSHGLGLKVTAERLNVISRIRKTKAYMAFEDLMDSAMKPAGTRAKIVVPVSYYY